MEYLNYESSAAALKGCRKTVARISWALVMAFGLFQGLGALLSIGVETLAPGAMQNGWISMAVGVLPLYLAGMPLFWLAVRRLPAARPCRVQGVGPLGLLALFTGTYTAALALEWVTLMWGDLLYRLTGCNLMDAVPAIEDLELLPTLLVSGILAPIMEELFFRVLVLRRLLPYGRLFAVITSSVMFGLFHANFFQMLYAFGIGLVLAYITIRTGSAVYATLVHIFFNSFNTVIGFLTLEYPRLLPLTAVPMVLAVLGVPLLWGLRRRIAYHLRPAPLPAAQTLAAVPRSVGFWLFTLCSLGLAVWILTF